MDNKKTNSLVTKIINLDRRVVYIFMFLAVSLPFFLKPVVSIKSTKWVKTAYELVEEAAKKRKPILIGFDFDPSTLAELQPMAKAMLRQAFSQNVKVVGLTFLPNGTALAATIMDDMAKEFGKVNGQDYVFLGYLPQYDIVLLNLGDDLRLSYPKDFRGIPIADIPVLKGIQNYDDFHVVICITGTKLAQAYILYGVNKYKFNYVAGVTAVSATEYFPYLQAGQMKGLLAGMKAAAEYEYLTGFIGNAMRGMASQNWGHIIIIIFIVIGNILFYIRRHIEATERKGF